MPSNVWGEFRFPVESKDEFYELCRELLLRRFRNLEPGQKLVNGTQLKIQDSATFSYLSLPPYDIASKLQPLNIYPSGTVFILQQSLTVDPSYGTGIKAPVWLAKINGNTVAVKIFQACFLQPEWSDSIGGYDFFPEEEQAHREAFGYTALKQLQGREIPNSYGFYSTILLSGDSVTIHVMEHVHGPTLEDIGDCNLTIPTKRRLIEELIGTCVKLDTLGVAHTDICFQNVILTSSSNLPSSLSDDEPNLHLTLVDFGDARALIDGESAYWWNPMSLKGLFYLQRRDTFFTLGIVFGFDLVEECMQSLLQRKQDDIGWRDALQGMMTVSDKRKKDISDSLARSQSFSRRNL